MPIAEIGQRKKHCFVIMKGGRFQVFVGDEARRRVGAIIDQIGESKTGIVELRGIIGSSGALRGFVRVIRGLGDTVKVKNKDILVVFGVSLDYLPVIQKAGGVIAEYGGLTSHVAIMCRELGIPALLQVRGAMEVLKDGDFVEYDQKEKFLRIKNG
jgi:pyruvate,water dikinase